MFNRKPDPEKIDRLRVKQRCIDYANLLGNTARLINGDTDYDYVRRIKNLLEILDENQLLTEPEINR